MRPAALAANAAIPRHHSVPLKMKIPPEQQKRQRLVRRIRRHELRQEGEEEQRHLRIERIGQHALPEYAPQGDGITRKGDVNDRGRARSIWMPVNRR